MSKFINIDNNHIVAGRVIPFNKGDVISISFRDKVSGFGLHFAPIQNDQAFNLRSINSSVGLDTYAPSQRFKLDGNRIRIFSPGDETVEVAPYRSGKVLVIRAKHDGFLKHDKKSLNHYRPPSWAYDYWFSTPWTRMSQETVLQEIDTAHHHHLDPKIWLLDAGWSSKSSYMNFDNELFPSRNGFLKVMQQKGVKPVLWLSPFIDDKTKVWYQFDSNNWLVKDNSGKSARFAVTGDNKSIGSYIDYTSKSLLAYLSQRIAELEAAGLKGLMFDFGESLPDGSRFSLETDSAKRAYSEGVIGHNWYVGEIKRVLHDIAKPLELCIISRSGWTESYSQTGLWLGDQSSDASRFAGLESVLWGYKTAYDAGYRFIGMDAGGYFGQPTIVDYNKWLDLSVSMPFTMLHGAIQANPWEVGDVALRHFRKCRELHRSLWQSPAGVNIVFKLNWNKQKVQKISANKFQFFNNATD